MCLFRLHNSCIEHQLQDNNDNDCSVFPSPLALDAKKDDYNGVPPSPLAADAEEDATMGAILLESHLEEGMDNLSPE